MNAPIYSPARLRRALRTGYPGGAFARFVRWLWGPLCLTLLLSGTLLAAPAAAQSGTLESGTPDSVLIPLSPEHAELLLTLLDRDPEGHALTLAAALHDEPRPADRITVDDAWAAVDAIAETVRRALRQ